MGHTSNHRLEDNAYRPDRTVESKASHPSERVAPQFGHRIEIEGREGIFVALRTDVERGTVDVLRISGIRQIEAGIPMASVHILHSQNSGDLLEKLDG